MIKTKNIFKSIVFWLIVAIISITLTLTNFTSNTNNIINDQSIVKIKNFYINDNEINTIINNIWKQKKYKNININQEIKNKIINNISFHTNISNKITTTNKELLYSIYNLPQLQVNGHFSYKLYKDFLKKIKSNEYNFQKNIKILSLKNQIKQGLKLSYINLNNQETEKKIDIKYTVKSIQSFDNTNNIDTNKIIKFYQQNYKAFALFNNIKIEYIHISIKNIIKTIKLNDNKIDKCDNKYYKKHENHNFIKLKSIFIKNSKNITSRKKNILSDIKNKNYTFDQLVNKYDQSKKKSNKEVGWITQGELNTNIEKIAFDIKNINDVSNIIKTKQGIHLIQLQNKITKKLNNKKFIKTDFINTCKRIYAKKYILKNYKNIIDDKIYENTQIKLKDISNITQKKSNYISQHTVITKKCKNTIFNNQLNNNILKLNNIEYIIFKIIKNKKNNTCILEKHIFLIKKYLQKIKKERYLINKYKNINNDTDIKWNFIQNININNYKLPKTITTYLLTIKNKNLPIIKKLKNNYYYIIIKDIKTKTFYTDDYIKYEYQAYKNSIVNKN